MRPSCATARELRIGGEGALFDGEDGTRRPWRGRRRRGPLDDQGRIAPGRERLQREALLAVKAHARPLARGAVQAHIGHALEPLLPLLLEVAVIDEGASVDEIAAQIADRALDLALRLRAIRPACAGREAPVMREPEKLRIADQRAALQPEVSRDHRLHLIEEQLLWNPTETERRDLR